MSDAGPYQCVSTNNMGRADHVIRIYGAHCFLSQALAYVLEKTNKTFSEIKRATDPPRHRADHPTTQRYRGEEKFSSTKIAEAGSGLSGPGTQLPGSRARLTIEPLDNLTDH